MENLLSLLLVTLAGVVLVVLLQLVSLVRAKGVDLLPLERGLESLLEACDRGERLQREDSASLRQEVLRAFAGNREELAASLRNHGESLAARVHALTQSNDSKLERVRETVDARLERLTAANDQKMEALRAVVEQKLEGLQQDNSKQLELMRRTVDEKLEGTLERRLGESFRQVSERLERVSEGLGEMRTLATGVGDLKKVLTNVKTRGTWGEVQLGALLEQVLTRDQYEANVATRGGAERVEFAVRMPGRGDSADEPCWLPIDAKFPIEDYQRLVDAQERSDAEAVEAAGRQVEQRIKACARDISSKYLSPPATTEFGILFLPTESLFAEVLRRPGLCDFVQRESRVVIAGPTTLWSILSSLQMGFRTLAIEKRSSEVWNLLAAVKTEWSKYGDVLAKVQRKLNEASSSIDAAQVRTRAIGRRLRGVEELPPGEATAMLTLSIEAEDAEEEAVGSAGAG